MNRQNYSLLINFGAEVAKDMKILYDTVHVRKKKSSFIQEEHFVVGTTARAASEIIGVQANTAIRFYMRSRRLIASQLPETSEA